MKFNCGYKGSQDLEDSAGGRPSSPRYNPTNEAAACEECVCSNPSRVIGVGRSRSMKAGCSNVHEVEGVGFMSGRAVHWQRSASQSCDRWTMFTLGGPCVWQQDLGIKIQHFSHRTTRSNTESVEPRVHWRSQTWSLQSKPFTDYSVSMYESERRNNVQCSLPPICKLVAAYQGLNRSFHNGTPRRPWLPITL